MSLGLALPALLLSCAAKRVEVDSATADRSELIYFVLVDRFANGDPSNDTASPGPNVDRADPQAWHGGDLRGVIDHLDHVAGLGATQLWLSPIFTTRTEPIGEWGAYHGYWQWDPTTVEPRFGTQAELEELSEALEARQVGLLLDLVTNHVGYAAPVEAAHPDWFHATPSIEDWQDRVQLETWRVHGLPDLDQDHPEVAAWLHGVAARWQGLPGLRGYRVDAVRHVPNRFLAELGAAVRARDPQAWWLGEDFTGDVAELAESQRTGGFTHVFDFPLHYAMTDVFCDDAPPARLASVLWQDRLYERPEGLVTFLDNHDLPRIFSRCHEDADRVLRALAFQFATRGVPALTYGTEALLPGEEEPANRADMVFDSLPLGQPIAELARQRREDPARRGGVQRVIHLDADSMALARVQGDRAVVVGVNRGASPVSVVLPAPLAEPGAPPLVLPPRSVHTWSLEGRFDGWLAEGPPTTVPVRVTGAPAGQVRLVGADPVLGGWDPDKGLALRCEAGVCSGQLTQPAGAVLEGKPVVLAADGVQWAEGENRALLVQEGATWEVAW